MATAEASVPEEPLQDPTFSDRMRQWFVADGAWYAASFVFHMVMACVLMLVSVGVKHGVTGDAPEIESAQEEKEKKEEIKLDKFEVGETPLEPTELNTDTLAMNAAPAQQEQKEEYNDDSAVFSPAGGGSMTTANGPQLGGLGGFDVKAIGAGPALHGKGGVGSGVGTGGPGAGGGHGSGFGGRGTGHRKAMLGSGGGTKQSERAVAAALFWLAHHQSRDGSWSFTNFSRQCKAGDTCSGPGSNNSDAAATAVGLLPFLAAGQTHEGKGPYRQNIYNALYWLMSHQAKTGSLAAGSGNVMYTHGLASIAMCEAYGLTNDRMLGQSAQAAINFIVAAQHPTTGGWRYTPGMEGDTSVVGWQVMALKSGMMAYLNVDPKAFTGAKHWLDSVAGGDYKGRFSYTPGQGAGTPTMTAVGLLCRQYLGMKRDDMAMQEGMGVIMGQLPQANTRPLYFWYYATQVMHNLPGPEWDKWNREMRRTLIDTQCKEGCAAGSWDPQRPAPDPHLSEQGGRVLITGLSTLTLEVYYRYLPLYKLDAEGHGAEAALKAEVKGDAPDAKKK
jgi:hypothetical protein